MHNPLEILQNRLKAEFPKDDHGKKADFIRTTKIPRVTLDRWMSGKTSPKIEELVRLSKWFKQEPWELIKPEGALPTPAPKEPGNAELIAAMKKMQARIDELEAREVSADSKKNLPLEDQDLFLGIVSAWPRLKKGDRGRIARLCASLAKGKSISQALDSLGEKKKSGA